MAHQNPPSSDDFLNNKRQKETAVIIQPDFRVPPKGQEESLLSVEERCLEIQGLAQAIALEIIHTDIVRVDKPLPGYLIGKGNRERIAKITEELEPDVVIVNHSLSPVQQRNLERAFKAKVIDRTGLILEIFGERAQTKEGQIQVELAALEYQKSRLVRSWTHLERQRGGAGFMGGPGETQIEIDRRIITDKIAKLKKDLDQVRKTRELQRRNREKVPYPIIALVGYTNAGKSTLFNHLTGASVFAEDLLFATLDPTARKITLPNGQEAIISDTVGFITDLPTHLIAAFRATLEQVVNADVILHVRDIAKDDSEAQKQNVMQIMEDLGVDAEEDPRVIEVMNKLDLVPEEDRGAYLRKAKFEPRCVLVSALEGKGMEELLDAIERGLAKDRVQLSYIIPAGDGEAVSWLYQQAHVLGVDQTPDNPAESVYTVDIDKADAGRFESRFDYHPCGKDRENQEQDYATSN